MSRAIRGGCLFASDGTAVNEADIIRNATDATGARIAMDEVHAFVNRGIVFDITAKITLAGNQTIYLTGETNGAVVHFIREAYVTNEGGVEFRMLEDVTFTGGTPITGINRNRTSSNIASLVVKSGATVTGLGTELYILGLPLADSPQGRGAQAGAEAVPWVLNSEYNYAIEIKNLDNVAKTIYAQLSWYEVTP